MACTVDAMWRIRQSAAYVSDLFDRLHSLFSCHLSYHTVHATFAEFTIAHAQTRDTFLLKKSGPNRVCQVVRVAGPGQYMTVRQVNDPEKFHRSLRAFSKDDFFHFGLRLFAWHGTE